MDNNSDDEGKCGLAFIKKTTTVVNSIVYGLYGPPPLVEFLMAAILICLF